MGFLFFFVGGLSGFWRGMVCAFRCPFGLWLSLSSPSVVNMPIPLPSGVLVAGRSGYSYDRARARVAVGASSGLRVSLLWV